MVGPDTGLRHYSSTGGPARLKIAGGQRANAPNHSADRNPQALRHPPQDGRAGGLASRGQAGTKLSLIDGGNKYEQFGILCPKNSLI